MSGRAPPYGLRANGTWIPRTAADFGDGGAFPEIHAAQYPLGMGEKNEKKEKSNALALQVKPIQSFFPSFNHSFFSFRKKFHSVIHSVTLFIQSLVPFSLYLHSVSL